MLNVIYIENVHKVTIFNILAAMLELNCIKYPRKPQV